MASSILPMPSHLHLPPEIWSITLQLLRNRKSPEDLTYLWTTVRHVSKQFREEVEDIFLTEHLPKTWVYVDMNCATTGYHSVPTGDPPARTATFDFGSKLDFDQIQSEYPGRAVFSLHPLLRGTLMWPRIFDALHDHLGPGRLGEAENSVTGSRTRLFENPTGIFVIQVRGVLGDCALPALNINCRNYQLSFGWKALFNRIFGERKLVATSLDSAPADHPLASTEELDPTLRSPTISQKFIDQLAPGVQALAELDWHTHRRHMQELRDGAAHIQCLLEPIQAWIKSMGDEFGKGEITLRRCRLQRQADKAANLDDEGAIDQANIDRQNEKNQAAKSHGVAEWFPLTEACDACRLGDRQCLRDPGNGDPQGCDNCVDSGSPCESLLAFLNVLRPHYVTTKFRTQQMLATQRSRAMICGPRQELGTRKQSLPQPAPAATVNLARQEYEMQLMLLEQQNRRRLVMARQNQGAQGLIPLQSSRANYTGLYSPLSNLVSQSYRKNRTLLRIRNRELFLLATQPSVNIGKMPPASQPTAPATMIQSHTSQVSGPEPPRTQPEQNPFNSSPATTGRQPESMPGPSHNYRTI